MNNRYVPPKPEPPAMIIEPGPRTRSQARVLSVSIIMIGTAIGAALASTARCEIIEGAKAVCDAARQREGAYFTRDSMAKCLEAMDSALFKDEKVANLLGQVSDLKLESTELHDVLSLRHEEVNALNILIRSLERERQLRNEEDGRWWRNPAVTSSIGFGVGVAIMGAVIVSLR